MWKRIRSHVSSKDEKSESSSTNPPHAFIPATAALAKPFPGLPNSSTIDDLHDVGLPSPEPRNSSLATARIPGSKQWPIDELGLHVVHRPPSPASVDIIFVHGLGGASHRTWSKDQNPSMFWPQRWLSLEEELHTARILTFGYNADFRSGGPQRSNIADFAKDLLFGMKFGNDDSPQDPEIGKVPIIFVVHSMGGLVVKKAYLLGQNDDTYKDVIKSISAMVFLATPHRGTALAKLLNRVLFAFFQSPKDFIGDLNRSSQALEDINEQFRHVAPKLSIFSFYETLPTPVGPKRVMVLDKESSILGYPGEVSKSLNADHHDVCKYASQNDPNYVSVKNALKTLVKSLVSEGNDTQQCELTYESDLIEQLFKGAPNLDDAFDFLRQRWMPGTCEWVTREPLFEKWLKERSGSRVIWYSAPPASGKSVLSAFIISHVQELGHKCQYFLFRFGDQTKHSTAAFLKYIGLQMAQDIPEFGQEMAQRSRQGFAFDKKDSRAVWRELFLSVLSRLALPNPLYLVIDALDESESPELLLELLQSLPKFRTPMRIFVVSRKTESLSRSFDKLSVRISVDCMQNDSIQATNSDIRIYLEHEVKFMRGAENLKSRLVETINNRSHGNFLWANLVLEEVLGCHTQQSLEKRLDELPAGMVPLYQRIERAIASNSNRQDLVLAKTILTWVVGASRPLTLQELSHALNPEFPDFLDLQRTIQDICGQFIVVDRSKNVMLLHKTVRDYLTSSPELELFIDEKEAHRELFKKTISVLLRPDLRSKIGRNPQAVNIAEPFLLYAATSFTYHLQHAGDALADTMEKLRMFFERNCVLSWIHFLALSRQLEVLTYAAEVLVWICGPKGNHDLMKNAKDIHDTEFLERWATDLTRIVAKFGCYLQKEPTTIYTTIPPLCPQKSIIFEQFGQSDLSVSGITYKAWHDCLARISLQSGGHALRIACAGRHIAVLDSVGSIELWDSVSFENTCTLHHAEFVTEVCFNSRCDQIASYGNRTTKIWDLLTGRLVSEIPNPTGRKALAMTFAENDTKIVMGSSNNLVMHVCMTALEEGWLTPIPTLLKGNPSVESGVLSSPSIMCFNSDATQIAVASRGYPLSVWTTNETRLIGRCRRIDTEPIVPASPPLSWMAVKRVAWNPLADQLFGLYDDGCVFKWNPISDEVDEKFAVADEIQVSPDGRLFLTSDTRGKISVWSLAQFIILHQVSEEGIVTGLAFSPDCRRFYDIRGSSLNAWDNITADKDAVSEMISEPVLHNIGGWETLFGPISAIAAAPGSQLYGFSRGDSKVDVFDKNEGKVLEISDSSRSSTSSTILQLNWSEDGKHLAAADAGGTVMVKNLRSLPPTTAKAHFEVLPILTCKAKFEFGAIHQILLNRDSTRLLIVCTLDDVGQVWLTQTGMLASHGVLTAGERRIWLNHPCQKDVLIGVGFRNLKFIHWEDLTTVTSVDYHEDCLPFGNEPSLKKSECVRKAMITQDGQHLLVQLSQHLRWGRIGKRLLIFKTSTLDCLDGNPSAATITSVDISNEVMDSIEVPLGVLPGQKFVFLDKDLWMCTIRLDSIGQPNALRRHYFIPRDWTSKRDLEQCCLLQDGTFLCPKDGEVAVIRSSLGQASW